MNFNGLLQRLQFLEASELVSPHLNSANQLLAKLSANIQRAMGFQYQLNRSQLIGLLLDIASCKPVSCFHSQFGQSACWAPFDIYMENAMDGKQLPIKSAVDVLTGCPLLEHMLFSFSSQFSLNVSACACACITFKGDTYFDNFKESIILPFCRDN